VASGSVDLDGDGEDPGSPRGRLGPRFCGGGGCLNELSDESDSVDGGDPPAGEADELELISEAGDPGSPRGRFGPRTRGGGSSDELTDESESVSDPGDSR
jgi:hypothetical protein